MSKPVPDVREVRDSDIAIIGMHCHFPGAKNIEQFWQNLRAGLESVVYSSDEELRAAGIAQDLLSNPHFVKARVPLDEIEMFDASFFGLSPREAEAMDPQQRLFLECAWELMEIAGYGSLTGKELVGVYAGVGTNQYVPGVMANDELVESLGKLAIVLGNDKDSLATIASYKLNLKGPSFSVQTACSTSLVAVHLACQGLFAGECDMALAGGVSLDVLQRKGYLHQDGDILSPDGHCRAFDARAQGTVPGAGAGAVLLKRLTDALADGDTIHAVIKGSAINNDGSSKVGYTAPSIEGQARVIRAAQALAEAEAESISYIEAHGTGTSLGDPIEIAALTEAFRAGTGKTAFCAVGSVKTNIGHLGAAAGVAGLIKASLGLRHKQLPASLNFESPNPKIDFENSPFFVNTQLREWIGPRPLRAGVSSFGMGGTNAHVILQEGPEREPSGTSRSSQVLVLSARTDSALKQASKNLARYLKEHEDVCLADVAYTLQVGRKSFPYRQSVVCSCREDAINILEGANPECVRSALTPEGERGVVFLFPGQGAQSVRMGWQLYENEAAFRRVVDECCEWLKPVIGLDLRQILYPAPDHLEEAAEQLQQTAVTQPVLFVVEYALARLWMDWGIRPQAMIGHSVGEYVAACLAGVMSLKDALELVAVRGRLMQQMPRGSMLAVGLSEEAVQPWLGSELSLAGVNGPNQCVLSGPSPAIDELQNRLQAEGINSRRLATSHAFHSRMMEPILESFHKEVSRIKLGAPRLPYISNRTGEWISATETTDPGYWVKHLREPVRFAPGIQHILKTADEAVFLEVGPGQTLSSLVRRSPGPGTSTTVFSSLPAAKQDQGELSFLLDTVGKLWLAGAAVDWYALHAGEKRNRVPLPTYPFERQRYWVNAATQEKNGTGTRPGSTHKKAEIADWFYLPYWKPSVISNHSWKLEKRLEWLVFLDEEGLGSELVEHLAAWSHDVITVVARESFSQLGEKDYSIRPQQPEDYAALLASLRQQQRLPQRIVHLWSVTAQTFVNRTSELLDRSQDLGFYSLVFLARALGRQTPAPPIQTIVVSNNLHSVTGDEHVYPEKATVLAPCRVIPQEYPQLGCRSVDLMLAASGTWQRKKTLQQLVAEVVSESTDLTVAYRGQSRWVESFEPFHLEKPVRATSRLQEGGVYLLTGGLGNIGLAIAEYFARRAKARLVLVGRSSFPEPEEWEQWLASHDGQDPISRKIGRLQDVRNQGAEILLAQADVGDLEQMRQVIALIHERFGPIHGVIHAAGHVGESLIKTIEDIDAAHYETHFRPKVRGLQVLEEVLQNESLDFCLLFSSLASLACRLGSSAYSAVNLFMDAFAQARQHQHSVVWTSVNWDRWDLGDDDRVAGVYEHTGRPPTMKLEEGLEALDRILQLDCPAQLVNSTADLDARLKVWTQPGSSLGPRVVKGSGLDSAYSRPALGTAYVAPTNEAEERICELWRGLLGIGQIGIHDNFFELGGNSLVAAQLLSRLRKVFPVEIPLTALFENATVAQLAKVLAPGTLAVTSNGRPALRVEGQLQTLIQAPTSAIPVLIESGKPRPSLAAGKRPERLPLSYAQQRLWFINQLEGSSAEYNICDALRLRGELDRVALERAIDAIVARHEVLRTHFAEVEGEPVQIIEPEVRIIVSVEDLSVLDEASQAEQVAAAQVREAEQPFDLARGPLIRMKLVKLGSQDHILLRTLHHIISDGWSLAILNREFAVLYEAFHEGRENPLAPLPVQYADFTLWQRATLDQETVARDLEYWKQQLLGIPEQLDLPMDRQRRVQRTSAGEMIRATLPLDQSAALQSLSQANHATLYMTLLSAFAVLLHRYSGQDDIVVGTPIADRHDPQLEQLIGYFLNALVMRTRVKADGTFRELLAEVRATALEAYRHQDIPFEQLREELSSERTLKTLPIFQVMFALQNVPMTVQRFTGLEVEPARGSMVQVRFDLEAYAFERDERIGFYWVYARDLFDQWRIEQMLLHYQRLLEAAVAAPDAPLRQLDILTPEERVQLLQEWNSTKGRQELPRLLHQMFEEQAQKTPVGIAVEYEGEPLTFAQLDQRANQLAHYLQKLGVAAEVRVGVCLERCPEMIVALLGVLKAGGAYVPLDPVYPVERLAYMAQDSRARVLLTQTRLLDRLPHSTGTIVELDGHRERIEREDDTAPEVKCNAENLAYLIYTSGSTGKPKGVAVEHRQICNQLLWAGEALQLTSADRVLQKASFSFDASLLELFLPLAWGAGIVVAKPGGEQDLDYLVRLVIQRSVTYVDLAPSLLEGLLDHPLIGDWKSLRVMSSGAEVLKPEVVTAFYQALPYAALWNTYGPTEATVQSTSAVCLDDKRLPPIGRPILNTQTYVLDRWLEPAAVGVPGELYLGGAGLARGYWNRPELTAERLVPNLFTTESGERLYRTGDLARWRPDGNLEFVGRVDHQVKVRGYRIELGEIEETLKGHECVQDALVTIREQSGQKQLLAYVIVRPSEAEQAEAEATRIGRWQEVYESTYWQSGFPSGDFDIEGWNSSYTGGPIPANEMRMWVDETVAAIRALRPTKVLEIGCGTGLLLTRLAVSCESYVGMDFSRQTLSQLGDYLSQREDLGHVVLRQGLAHELSFLQDDSLDLVILNSVAQYFPNIDYLLQVLAEAVRVTRRGGRIFVGDVRSLPMLDAYHTSVQLYKAGEHTELEDLRQRISQAQQNEEELVLDPALFSELGRRWDKVGRVTTTPKSGSYDNELSRFRYDVTLELGTKERVAAPELWLQWDASGLWQKEVERALALQPGLPAGVRGIRDGRVAQAVEAVRLLRSADDLLNARQIRAACDGVAGEDPNTVFQFAQRLGVELCWQRFSADGVYDAVFNPRWEVQQGPAETQRSQYRRYGNAPMQREQSRKLGRILQKYLRQSLPEYMVPAAVMVVSSWPLTPSGKLDRQALPTPERHNTLYRGPREPREEMLCEIFADVLSLERVGIDDNFFSLGGHSLLAMRLVSRVRSVMGMELLVRTLFEAPTVAELSSSLTHQQQRSTVQLAPQARPARLPLSHPQRRLWFINQLEGSSPEYNIAETLRLRGELDYEALERTVNTIVQRHEVLRTHFEEVDGEPVQIIEPELRIAIPREDLSGFDEATKAEKVRAAMAHESDEPLDLACGPLLRMKLLKLGSQEYIFLRTFHHIISDGWSHGVFTRELMVLYEAFCEGRENPLPPLPVQYADFTLWQRAWLGEETVRRELEYWKQKLAGIPQHLELPQDRPRPPQQTFAADLCLATLPADSAATLKRLAQDNQATLYMMLVSVFAVLLQRYSGQEDIVVGSPIANRPEPQLEQLIGLFVNSLVLRMQINTDETFREFMAAVRRSALEAYLHQDIPFERLVEELSPQRTLNISPIFQVLFALQNAPMGSQRLKKLVIEPVRGDTYTARVDLEVHAFEREGQIIFYWLYKRDLFDRWRMEQMAQHYTRLLNAVSANPDQRLNQFDLLSAGERQQVLVEWNCTQGPVDHRRTILELLEEKVREAANAPAVTFKTQQLTYAELNRRANQLGHYLRKLGVGPEVRVGACLARGPAMIVAFLGIMKAGGVYVPLDPDFPPERLAYMVQDTGTPVVLTQTNLRPLLPGQAAVIDMDADWERIAGQSAEAPDNLLEPGNAAYVIYTSGSMGKPKGVVIEHRNVLNMVRAQHAAFAVRDTDRVLQFFSFSFDVSVFATLMALGAGARLVLGTRDDLMPGPRLLALLETEKITIGVLPPIVLDYLPETQLPLLRQLIVGGESWSEELLKTWGGGRQFFNSYGPTETTVQATVGECRAGEGKPTIGRPITNARIYLLDKKGSPAPAGVAGELYIGGEGVGRGYLDCALTAEKFVPDPFSEQAGARLYRTGDWARWLPDGRIDLLGRKDEQVKIRGYRVELGEIESVLAQHPSVLQCAVLVRQEERREKRLVAYVVSQKSQTARAVELRSYLKDKLPDYMVPSRFVLLEELPLNSSGKVDRRALPAVDFGSSSEGRAPRTPEEDVLCQIFAEILGLARVAIDDSFFDLGGHSLLATRLVSRVRSILGVELPLRTIFESPTVAGLSPHLRQAEVARIPLTAQARPERLPMSYAQRRLWFLDQLEGKSTEYNIPEAVRLRGKLDYEALEQAINTILQRHEVLRTRFAEADDGEPVQIIEPHLKIHLPVEDLSALDEELRRQRVAAAVRDEREHAFNLSQAPLLRMRLLKLGEQEHILLRTFHHIVTDGWSQGIFNHEFMELYAAFCEEQPDPLEPLAIQYADFALWQRQWLNEALQDQLGYWRQQLAALPEELALPKDRPRPPVQTYEADSCHLTLMAEHLVALKRLSQSSQATLYMTVLSAFAILLHRYSGQDDVVLGSPIANRQEEQLEKLMGFFVNSLVLRVRVNPKRTFSELLADVRGMALDAYRHQDLPFERLVEELSPQRSLNKTPIYQVLFLWQNAPVEAPKFKDLAVEYLPPQGLQTHFDLELQAMERGQTLHFHWIYNRDLFDRWRMEQMSRHYEQLLRAAVSAPQIPLHLLPMLAEEEKQQLLVEWNATDRPYSAEDTIQTLFEQQAARTPEAYAVVAGERRLSYRELNERANQLAHYLKEQGVGPEVRVGVCLERDLEMLVGLLGILKAGGAYVPLDPKYPVERLSYMVEDSQSAVLLTQRALLKQAPGFAGTMVRLNLEEQWDEIATRSSANPKPSAVPGNLAYVIYTSGSTGKPKGVAICHSNVAAFIHWSMEVFRKEDLAGVLFSTSICFDLSVFEMFVPLACGGSVLVAEDALELASMANREQVKLVNTVPSALRELVRMKGIPASVRTVNSCGEVLSGTVVYDIYETSGVEQVVNLYGPSEDTIYSTYISLPRRQDLPPIGKPITNSQAYVLDQWLEPVPIGVAGDLYLAGAGLARGYLNRPDLTADRFIPDPFSAKGGGRLYHTGDLVKWAVDGSLAFLGRGDDQVKIRGFRIELGEIESVLQEHPEVGQAVVVAREEDGGEKRLAAYIVAGKEPAVSAGQLRDYLRGRIPEHMMPAYFVFMERLPLTQNGKVNRKALPRPEAPLAGLHLAPRTAFEQMLANVWQKELAVERVGLDDNFFDLGGHSLLVARVRFILREKLKRNIALVDFFTYPTVRLLAQRLEEVEEKPVSVSDSHERASRQKENLRRRWRSREPESEKETVQ